MANPNTLGRGKVYLCTCIEEPQTIPKRGKSRIGETRILMINEDTEWETKVPEDKWTFVKTEYDEVTDDMRVVNNQIVTTPHTTEEKEDIMIAALENKYPGLTAAVEAIIARKGRGN